MKVKEDVILEMDNIWKAKLKHLYYTYIEKNCEENVNWH